MQTKNTNNILDKLYDLSSSEVMPRHSLELQKTRERLMELIGDPPKESALQDSILDYGLISERRGFDRGFILAVHIMSQCIGTAPIPDPLLPFDS